MKQFVIGIDPGLKTGVCVVDTRFPSIIQSDEFDLEEYVPWLDFVLREYPQDNVVVVCERFVITPQTHKNGQATWSLENIGVAKSAVLRAHGNLDLFRLSSTDAKLFSTNAKLKAVDMWHKGGAGHANDALRHAMRYMVEVGWKDQRLVKEI